MSASTSKPIMRVLDQAGAYWIKTTGIRCRNGIADFAVCYRGLWISAEEKGGTGRVTPLQEWELKRVRDAGGISGVIRSPDDMRELLAEADRRHDR